MLQTNNAVTAVEVRPLLAALLLQLPLGVVCKSLQNVDVQPCFPASPSLPLLLFSGHLSLSAFMCVFFSL